MTFFLNFLFFVQAQTVTVQSDIERHTDIYKQVSLTWWNLSHFHLDLYFTMLKVRGIKHHKLINLIKNGVCALCVHFVNPFRHCCQIKLVDLTFSHSACWSDLFKYSLFIWPFQIQLVCLTFTMFTYKFWRCYYFYSDLFIVQWQIFHAFSVPIRQKSNKEGMYTDWVDGDGDFHWEIVYFQNFVLQQAFTLVRVTPPSTCKSDTKIMVRLRIQQIIHVRYSVWNKLFKRL